MAFLYLLLLKTRNTNLNMKSDLALWVSFLSKCGLLTTCTSESSAKVIKMKAPRLHPNFLNYKLGAGGHWFWETGWRRLPVIYLNLSVTLYLATEK